MGNGSEFEPPLQKKIKIGLLYNFSEHLRPASMKVLKAALQPMATDVSLTWDVEHEGKRVDICTVPSVLPPIFADNYLTAFGLIPASKIGKVVYLLSHLKRSFPHTVT